MTLNIDAAIMELEFNQLDLEHLAMVMRDKEDNPGITAILEKCMLIRMYLLEKNIQWLTDTIIKELQAQELTITDYTPVKTCHNGDSIQNTGATPGA